jgi:hypothetical protein
MFMLPSHLSYDSVSKVIKERMGNFLGRSHIRPSYLIPQKVNVVHAIPGRLRLQCNRWKNRKISKSLQIKFTEHPLVDRASTSPITGSLLLELNVDRLSKDQFKRLVQFGVDAAYPHQEYNPFRDLKDIAKYKGKRFLDRF